MMVFDFIAFEKGLLFLKRKYDVNLCVVSEERREMFF
jgi:hypothetical protein